MNNFKKIGPKGAVPLLRVDPGFFAWGEREYVVPFWICTHIGEVIAVFQDNGGTPKGFYRNSEGWFPHPVYVSTNPFLAEFTNGGSHKGRYVYPDSNGAPVFPKGHCRGNGF